MKIPMSVLVHALNSTVMFDMKELRRQSEENWHEPKYSNENVKRSFNLMKEWLRFYDTKPALGRHRQ